MQHYEKLYVYLIIYLLTSFIQGQANIYDHLYWKKGVDGIAAFCNPVYKGRAAIQEEKLCFDSWPASTLYQGVLLRACRKFNPASEVPPPWASLLFASSHTVLLGFIISPKFRQTISDCFACSLQLGWWSLLLYLWAQWRTFFACLYPKWVVSSEADSASFYPHLHWVHTWNLCGVASLPHGIGHHYIFNLHLEILWKVKATWKLTQTLSPTPKPPAKCFSLAKSESKFYIPEIISCFSENLLFWGKVTFALFNCRG